MKLYLVEVLHAIPYVAPRAGAWIETWIDAMVKEEVAVSHPARVRGLKPETRARQAQGFKSHPARVRGLKLMTRKHIAIRGMSHPARVRGLKHIILQ